MNKTSLYLLFLLATECILSHAYAQSDSVRTEITQEQAPTESVGRPNSERAITERKLVKELFRRSRREVTLIEIGFDFPISQAGIFLPNDPRPGIEQTNLSSLWVGVEHKLTPAWAILGGVGWQYTPKTAKATVSGTSWLGQVGLNYYPAITKAMREGRSANNFYRQYYITARAFLPFHDQLTIDGSNPRHIITANPFQQAAMLGMGLHSKRTRFYFYNLVFGAAYLFGRDEGINHSIQFMAHASFGFGF